ncbi:MAG: aryl-sulfate sulfotransferase [Ruminococcus sp.]|jgi:arylsulfate sulfotransferase
MKVKKHKKKLIIIGIIVLLLIAAVPAVVIGIGKMFTAQEKVVRTDWVMEAGQTVDQNEEWQIEYAQAQLGDGIQALQLVPMDIEEEGFTYYDVEVQERLENALESLKRGKQSWTAETPLAVLNPYGTGSNGLYMYFETERKTQVTYTIHVEDDSIPDYTKTVMDASGENYTKTHEFQIIGLVPGAANEVTMEISGSWGNVRQTVKFNVDMPENQSGYSTKLETTEGESGEKLSEGLYAMMRVNGYLGYGFFFDNDGIMRYEMLLEGYGMDRVLFYDNDIITCASAEKLARINSLGQVEQVYDLDGYAMHHDIGFGQDGELLVLAEKNGGETVEDQVLSVDIASGEVTELIDFTEALSGYFEMTRPIAATDPMFWQVGEWDWIHLNSLQYMAEDDSLIVSSRETSTIIKVKNIHNDIQLDWLAGDNRFWEDTPYAEYCLEQDGDFVPQYGQHCVEYIRDGEGKGVYYLALYNNNYWALSSRDFSMDVADSVGTDLYDAGGSSSQVYVYKIDENAGTFSLESSFDVPYSSIVSNGSLYGEEDHWIVNSGVAMVFGEYDSQGVLIRQYAYECTMQNYRTIKYDFTGFWFM